MLNNLSVTAKGLMAFAAMALIGLATSYVSYTKSISAVSAVNENAALQVLIGELNQAELTILDQAVSLKNFLLTGDRAWATQVEDTGKVIAAQLSAVEARLGSAGLRSTKIAEVDATWRAWIDQYAKRQILLMRDPMTVDLAKAMEVTGKSAALIETIQSQIKEQFAVLAQRQSELATAQQSELGLVEKVAAFSALVVVGFAVVLGYFNFLTVSRPLAVLANVTQRLAEGDLATEVPESKRRDELGRMGNALSVFRGNMIHARELEETAGRQKQIAEAERRADLERVASEFEDRSWAFPMKSSRRPGS